MDKGFYSTKKLKQNNFCFSLVGEGGFEPPKALPADLQSVPFGHSGIPPYLLGAGGRTRTPDLLITNQLLYRLSYTSVYNDAASVVSRHHWAGSQPLSYNSKNCRVCQQDFSKNTIYFLTL